MFPVEGIQQSIYLIRGQRVILDRDFNITIMRAFVRLRQIVASNTQLAHKLDELEKKYDQQFKIVFDAIRQLMSAPAAKATPIGFRPRALKK